MDSSKLFNWIQLGGTIGLLIGLLLVAFQINQATELTRLQVENEWRTNWKDQALTMMGEYPTAVIAKAVDDPHSLTTDELLILENYMNNFLEYWNTIKHFSEQGLSKKDRWREVFDRDADSEGYGLLVYYFGNPVGQAWWDAISEAGGWRLDKGFFEAADRGIRSAGPNGLAEWHGLIREKLRLREISEKQNEE